MACPVGTYQDPATDLCHKCAVICDPHTANYHQGDCRLYCPDWPPLPGASSTADWRTPLQTLPSSVPPSSVPSSLVLPSSAAVLNDPERTCSGAPVNLLLLMVIATLIAGYVILFVVLWKKGIFRMLRKRKRRQRALRDASNSPDRMSSTASSTRVLVDAAHRIQGPEWLQKRRDAGDSGSEPSSQGFVSGGGSGHYRPVWARQAESSPLSNGSVGGPGPDPDPDRASGNGV